MKTKNLLYLCIPLIITICLYRFWDNKIMPAPDNGETEVRKDADESDNQNKREKWFELLHQAEPGLNWRHIELENSLENLNLKQNLRKIYGVGRNDDEKVAGDNILGKWYERGSSNQAGNVIATAYDVTTDEIFLVSGGGSLFKGNRSGIGWEVINHDLRFSGNLMECIYLPNGNRRLLAAINQTPYYSDDEGKTWTPAAGIQGLGDGNLYHPQITEANQLFILQKRSYWAPLKLFVTEDHGETYLEIFNFVTSDTRNIAMQMDKVSEDVYVISQQSGNTSHIYKYEYSTQTMSPVTLDSPLGFGDDGHANLNVVNYNGIIRFYSYDGDLKLHVSDDLGASWQFLSTLPTKPWSVSLYVSPSNPNHMIYGEVDAFRSRDGGNTWQKINAWWEYYNDVPSKLHADIMALREFTDENEDPFILISNHGGLSMTYDGGVTNDNIGLFDLNVSQYYDVKSYPPDQNFVFAGAQDQGFQKGFIPGTNPEALVQVISGDYGHIAFTENGQRLWTVYPGGWVTYYPNPRGGGHAASFEVNSEEESVWIPPVVSSPIASENSVYMAGGNINGGKGSHLIKLTYNVNNNNIESTQFPFNFKTGGGELSAIAFSPFNAKRVYCATTNGKFYISQNGGDNFTYHALNLPGAQYLYGSHILPSSIDSNVVFICGTGYSNSGVMRSTNGGKTFKALNNGLPKTTIFNMAFNEDESLMYAATEAGPYVYIQSLDKWFLLSGTNTPNQTFWSVEYIKPLKIARFGTYGRGIWDFHFKESLTTSQENVPSATQFSIFPNPAGDFIFVKYEKNPFSTNRMEIFDVQGNKINVPFEKVNDETFKVNIESLGPGIYYVIFQNKKDKSIQKFIKTH